MPLTPANDGRIQKDSVLSRSALRICGRVKESLPHALYRTELDSGEIVLAHLAEGLRLHATRVLPGDRVAVEISRLDWGRGRIVERLKA